MKYYYGHSWKEALANPPVNIRSTKQLQQYQDCYTFVIPASEQSERSAHAKNSNRRIKYYEY